MNFKSIQIFKSFCHKLIFCCKLPQMKYSLPFCIACCCLYLWIQVKDYSCHDYTCKHCLDEKYISLHVSHLEEIVQLLKNSTLYHHFVCPVLKSLRSTDRRHVHLQEKDLFDILHAYYSVTVVRNILHLSNFSELTDGKYYHYTSNNCSQLTYRTANVVQDIKVKYNASCFTDMHKAVQAASLEDRWKSLDIGLPIDFQQDPSPTRHLWGFMLIVTRAYISTHGAVTSGNVTLYSYRCHDYEYWPIYCGDFDTVKDEVFVVSGHWGKAYYHTLIEDLPRLAPYIAFLRRNPHILIHTGNARHMRDMVSLLGISPSRVVQGSMIAKIVYMPSGYPCGLSGILNLKLLSEALRTPVKSKLVNRSTIVLIRRTTPHRMFLHHKEILTMLQEEASARGLQVVVFSDDPPPSMSHTQSLFQAAAIVVAPHGAGLSNIISCRPGTVVIEGLHHRDQSKAANMCYTTLALALGLRYHGVYFVSKDVLHHTANDYRPAVTFYMDYLLSIM